MKLEPKRTILGIDQAVFVQRLAMCDKAAKINHQLKTSTKERYNMDKKRRILLSSLALPALGLSACAGPALLTYQNETPKLVLRDYFNGKLKAWGMFTDRFGKVVKRFSVDMDCEWNGNQGVFDEHFVYSDGTLQRRVWHMVDEGDGRYQGRADDVVGQANGQTSGNAFRWQYTLALPVGERTWNVEFDDWMYLMDEQTMLNKSKMSKWGFDLGEVTLAFSKQGAPDLTVKSK